MGSPLYQQINNSNNIVQQFAQFKQTFQGNPRQLIQQLLNSGRVSQTQYNQAVQMAQQLQQMING